MITTIQEIIDLYSSVYYVEDPAVIPLIIASVISNYFPGAPVWLMLIGASSSGKSELINAITDLEIDGKKKVWQISSLTENTFLSGVVRHGKDTSLLTRLGRNGVIVMKDFTTQLSQNADKAQAIFAQLREIYDGAYTKETGMGNSLSWKGKLNFIGGVTEKIFVLEHKYGGMGTRAVNFMMPAVSRKQFTRISLRNNNTIDEARLKICKGFTEYICAMLNKLTTYTIPDLPKEHIDNIVDIVDFATLCRSTTERDFKGRLELTQSPEMPGRMANQLMQVSNVFALMNDGEIPDRYRDIVYRLALDSIPLGRRWVLKLLATYQTATTSGLAAKLNYPTPTVREWLEDLNVFGLCERLNEASLITADKWRIKDDYRNLLIKYEHITPTTESLLSNEGDTREDEGEFAEYNQKVSEQFDTL